MESEEVFLTPKQKRRKSEVIYECFRLMRDERSRYEKQANDFIDSGYFSSDTKSHLIEYSIEDNQFACSATSKLHYGESFSTFAPIPEAREEQVEELIELFAQSEAGLII